MARSTLARFYGLDAVFAQCEHITSYPIVKRRVEIFFRHFGI